MALTGRNELLVPLLKKPAKIIVRCAYEHSCQENNRYHSDIHSDYSEPSEQSNENITTGGVFMHGKRLNASQEQHLFDELKFFKKRKFILF